jgi:hypothetical protein
VVVLAGDYCGIVGSQREWLDISNSEKSSNFLGTKGWAFLLVQRLLSRSK